MNKILTSLAVASISMPVLAQNEYISPPELGKGEGTYYSYYLGRYPAQVSQFADGELRGKVATLKSISHRLDSRSYSTYTGMGRTFANLTIDIGEGDLSKFGKVSASNFTKTPARVFSGSVTWPTISGTPAASPAPWGGTSGEYSYPFTAPWLYLGQTDIVTEWNFTGGSLANAAVWGSTTSRSYYFDSYGNNAGSSNGYTTVASIPATRLNNNSAGVTGRCNDSEHGTTTTGAYCYIYAYVYGDYYSNYNWRGQLRYYTQSYYTGYNNPVIHATGFQANTTGLNLNTGCNNLHISGPMLFEPLMTQPQVYSTSGYSGYREKIIPWNNAFAGVDLVTQAGWNDSTSGAINLSQARHIRLPANKPQDYRRMSAMTYGTSSSLGPYNQYYYNDGIRYTY